jgi:hypothetical protein
MDWGDFFGSIGSGLTKQQLEPLIDAFFLQTESGRKLLAMSKGKRWLLNIGLLVVNAYGGQKLPEGTALQKSIKEVLVDILPEGGSRLIRGSPEFMGSEIAIASTPGTAYPPLGLLQLSRDEIEAISNWLKDTSPEDRQQFKQFTHGFSPEELQKFLSLSHESRKGLMDTFSPPKTKKPRSAEVQADLNEARNRLEERLRKRREGRGGQKC